MSDLSHTIRKFDRFELKCVVPMKAAEEFKQSLRDYLVPDDHGDSLGCYDLTSLYYANDGLYQDGTYPPGTAYTSFTISGIQTSIRGNFR